MTNAKKYQLILDEISIIHANWIKAFLAGPGANITEVFSNNANAGVQVWKVEQVVIRSVVWEKKRPKNEEVAHAATKLAELKVMDGPDAMNIIVMLRQGNTSIGVPWARLLDHSYSYFVTRELAEAANKKWHEEYDPRPGHFQCYYCRKQFPETQRVHARIYCNSEWHDSQFCSGTCATHDQWASEG